MVSTLDKTFSVVAPHLPRILVSPDALNRMLSVTRELPAALARFAYIECRLAANAPQVDVIFDINEDGRHILAGRNPVIRLSERLRGHPIWQRLRRFCREWTTANSVLQQAIRSIWLEFDLDASSSAVPVPGVFVRFEGGTYSQSSIPESAKCRVLCDDVLPLLLGRPVEPATISRLKDCFEALPPRARLAESGVMLQRSRDAVRLCIKDLPEDQLLDYLHRIGWSGDPAPLRAILQTFSCVVPGRSRAMNVGYVDVDIGSQVHAPVGLEYFLQKGWQQLVQGGLEALWLNRLVAAGLCMPEKRDAILSWPGYFHARFPHQMWPSIVLRHSNHIKIIHTPGQPLVAKAYLYFFHRFYRRNVDA